MHGAINTANRYEHCLNCGREAAFDTVLGACTVTSCARYFGHMHPDAERWENVLPAPAGPSHMALGISPAGGRVALRPPTPPGPDPGRDTPRRPRSPSTRELVEAERAVIAAAREHVLTEDGGYGLILRQSAYADLSVAVEVLREAESRARA